MRIENVGPFELEEYELANLKTESLGLEWLVYWYQSESGWYGGEGEAVGYAADKFYVYNLGHCSCYGPCDEAKPVAYSVAEFMRPKDSVHDLTLRPEVSAKVVEILGGA